MRYRIVVLVAVAGLGSACVLEESSVTTDQTEARAATDESPATESQSAATPDTELTPEALAYLRRRLDPTERNRQRLTKTEWSEMGMSPGAPAYRRATSELLPHNLATTVIDEEKRAAQVRVLREVRTPAAG